MGKGIAFEYKHRFPQMYDKYVEVCNKDLLNPGTLWLWKSSTPWVLNFPTKNDWKHPSKLEYLHAGLQKFKQTYKDKGIKSIAFPQLGIANGGLEWKEVRSLMYESFASIPDIDIEIYIYDKNSKDTLFDKLSQRVSRFSSEDYKHHLGLTNSRANLIQNALETGRVRKMVDFQNINGIGEKSFKQIFEFAMSHHTVETQSDKQPKLL